MVPSHWQFPKNIQLPPDPDENFWKEEQEARRQKQLQAEQEWKKILRRKREITISHQLFVDNSGWVHFTPKQRTTSQALYEAYCTWCAQRNYPPKALRELSGYLMECSNQYNIQSSTNIPAGNGKRLRGFIGLELQVPPDDTDTPGI